LKIYIQYDPLWNALAPDASAKVRKGNHKRLFDEATRKVRHSEKVNIAEGGECETARNGKVIFRATPGSRIADLAA
jgi:hypothetical protein